MLDHPDLVDLFALRRDVEGVDGLERRERLTGAAVEALGVIDDAVAWKAEEQRKADEKKARKR